jgi:hypothetical protein
MAERNCSRCGTTTTGECPTCTAWFEHRPAASAMTPTERVAELRTWFPILEISFSKMHQRIEELVGRPVWTHELVDMEALCREIETATPATFDEVIGKLPSGKPVIVVEVDDDAPTLGRDADENS